MIDHVPEKPSLRTCVGCAAPDARQALVRVVVGADGQVAFDPGSLGGRPLAGRGAHVHPRPECLENAARRGLARSFRREIRVDAATLGRRLADVAAARARDIARGAGVPLEDRDKTNEKEVGSGPAARRLARVVALAHTGEAVARGFTRRPHERATKAARAAEDG